MKEMMLIKRVQKDTKKIKLGKRWKAFRGI